MGKQADNWIEDNDRQYDQATIAPSRRQVLLKGAAVISLAVGCMVGLPGKSSSARTASGYHVSGPLQYGNLAVYLIHGVSDTAQAPLTLQEAIASRTVQVREIGEVNQLIMENLGDAEVFVQAGDIVKGGQQDRALTSSLVLPPHSGSVAVGSYCVEQGRWSRRGTEDAQKFSSATHMTPSREIRILLQAYTSTSDPSRQQIIWRNVASVQSRLSRNLGTTVASVQSTSSLQLALENETLAAAQQRYQRAMRIDSKIEDDVVGYVFAINGKLSSADIYRSNGLFRKMWLKLFDAGLTEAIVEGDSALMDLPSLEAVAAFINAADRGPGKIAEIPGIARRETRESDEALFLETMNSLGGWVHRSYLAK